MRALYFVIVALLAFGAGVGTSAAYRAYDDLQPEGRQLKCVAHGSICVGMDAKQAIFRAEDSLGGLTNVACGFDQPEVNVGEDMILSEAIQRGCSKSNYMIVFSDGRDLTGVWIENGKVVRLDRNPAHEVDF
jgi:hypothetical protein